MPLNKTEQVSASVKRTELHYQGEINKSMRYENEKWVTYPNSEYGNYPSSISYNANGFTGTLYAKRIKLVPKNKLDHWVRGRSVYRTDYWLSSWVNGSSSSVSPPNTKSGSYYDSATGQNVNYSIGKSGGVYQNTSKIDWIRYTSYGRSANYDKYNNNYLGFMSNNPTSYYAGRWTDISPGEAPDRYYGDPIYLSLYNWRLVSYGWDEPGVVNADYYASLGNANRLVYSNGSYWWQSEKGVLNKYRRGVWITYDLQVNLFQYRQDYAGNVALPDYVDYQYSDRWDVYVEYEGETYSSNLTANSVVIVDQTGNNVDSLIQGKQYTARVTFTNTGEVGVNYHEISLYDNGVWLNTIGSGYIGTGSRRTENITFTANNTGTRNFNALIDSGNHVAETNESDNRAWVDKPVYYVNLKAQSLVFLDSNNVAQNHLVKGRKYKAKVTYVNESQITVPIHKISLTEEATFLNEITTTSIRAGQTNNVYIEFIANNSAPARNFHAFVDNSNVVFETNENDNKISKGIRVNTLPVINLNYSPTPVYEGDTVTVCARPEDRDNDPLTVKLFIKKENREEQLVLERTNVGSGTQHCYGLPAELARYDLTATVNDGYNESSVSTWFVSNPLTIEGFVEHTDLWLERHLTEGNASNQFYSGETFILKANLVDYPADYVKVTMKGRLVSGSTYTKTATLTKVTNTLYTGEINGEEFTERYPLSKGMVPFIFEVRYANGQVRTDTVEVEIIGNVLGVYKLHRLY